MAEFKLGRIRFVWKNTWTAATTYYIDDVVRYGARTYICAIGHTSGADFNTDLEYSPTKWNQMSDGQSWTGDWNVSTFYKLNDVVKYGGLLYICNDSHTSAATTASGLEADQAKWTVYAEGFDWKTSWTVSTRYKVNDLVKYGGYTYVCNLYHTSAATAASGLEADQAKWDTFNPGVEYQGTWTTAVRYKLNDVVKYGAGLWICAIQHTADAAFLTDSTAGRWTQFNEGTEFENTWSNSTLYQPGDIVVYGGNQYIAKTVHTAASAAATPVITTTDWDLYTEGFKFQSAWANTTSYKIGEVVSIGGYTYLAAQDAPSTTVTVTEVTAATDTFTIASTTGIVVGMAVRFTGTTFGNVFTTARYYVKTVAAGNITVSTTPGGTTFNITADAAGTMTATVSAEPPNTTYWSRLNAGISWQGLWSDDRDYLLGDAVRFGANAYICLLSHRSEGDDGSTVGAAGGGQVYSRPDQDSTGTYWSLLSVGSETDILSVRGDLVYYGGAGPTRLPIGREGQVLVSTGIDPEWVTLGETDHTYFVATTGTDLPSPVHGRTWDKPFKTIRYACEQVERGPRNPDARYLLELNRVFVQREVTEFIQNQITNNIAPFIGFVYDDFKCERDVGFTLDAVIYDLCHGGNIKSRGVANSLIGGLSPGETEAYPGLTTEGTKSVAAYNYMLTVVGNVLAQTAPTINYQTLNGDNSTATVAQYFNSGLTAEATALTTVTASVTLITNAITARVAAVTAPQIAAAIASVPARYSPSNLIRIATGQYRETLPIIVPEQTCVIGDELRSTNAGPAGSQTNRSDAGYSVGALTRLQTVVDQIVRGTNVTESSGNTTVQSAVFPYASTDEAADAAQLVRVMQHQIDFKISSTFMESSANPTGYNTAFLTGFGDARTLLRENKEFIKEEITAYLTVNFPAVKYSRTKCKRDVAFIVDAMGYDLTYGGTWATLVAGTAYFDGDNSTTLQIDSTEIAATVAAYGRLKIIVQEIIANTSVTKSTGNAATQWTDSTNLTGGAAANVTVGALVDIITNIIQGDSTEATTPQINVTTIAGTNTFTSTAHGLAVGDAVIPRITANGLVNGVKYWVSAVASANTFSLAATYGAGTLTTFTNGSGLAIDLETIDYPTATNAVTSTTALITAANTLDAAQETIVQNVVDDLNAVAWHTDFVVDETSLTSTNFRIYVGKTNLVHTYVSGGTVTKSDSSTLAISNFVYNESTGYAIVTTATHGLAAGDIVNITSITVSCLSSGGTAFNAIFPSAYKTDGVTAKILYLQTKCIRDTRLILEAVMFDFMFNSNFKTREAAYSYLRASASEVFVGNQKTITRDALTNAKTEAIANVGGNATAQARIETLMTLVDDILYGATNEGSRCATGNRMVDYAVLQLERNRDYIVAEIDAYIDSTYTTTVTVATAATDLFTCSSTSWMTRNAAIRFTGTIGGVSTTTTYYVQNVVSATTFKIATTRDSNTAFDIATDGSGSMTVALYYSSTACLRDVNTYIDALKYDLKYPGNYKSRYAARYYANSVTGSLEEDMYYLRDSTGVRDQTLQGLTGDLLAPNEFGTSRVSAGAYASLDPGWGPEDYRTWIITRSPYVQGVTTLGTACIGQKIDGALHNGGNDSIVSNDFTQVLSDGIGAWITNNGRAELVSVFAYYNHIAYLAENGGRIRATNGNNSYGDFGSVAEGFDATETPDTGIVDNRLQFEAVIDRVITDGSALLQIEFQNAGIDYTEVNYTLTGGGSGQVVETDEFRDDAVFEIRMLDLIDDSTNAPEADGNLGGFGYITNSNTAQGGTSTSVTIAATDGESSTAYIGMKIVITGGAGVGQFGIINTYNSGTKVAGLIKESDGTAGFDHLIAGTTIASPDASTTYIIEPRVTFTAPGYTSTAATLPTSGDWTAVKYGETAAVYTTLTGTYTGSGLGATFTVIRNGWKYTPSVQAAGTGYTRLQTITILGTSLGGTTTTNDLVITITAVNSTTGAIIDFDHSGYGIGGRYVAIRGSSTVGATSEDGVSWTTRTSLMPSVETWSAMAAGLFDDNSSLSKVSRFVAVAGVAANTKGAYSDDGITWSATSMVTSAAWVDVAFGAQKFVAVSSDVTTVRISNDGENWDQTGTLTTTGFTAIAYGKNRFVAIKRGSSVANYATSTTVTGTWTAGALPSSSNWESIAYGNNRFVAISNTNGAIAAYSLDGITWTASTLPATADWYKVTYGQGVFLAVSESTAAATSPDGITWTTRTTSTAASGFNSITFGNRDRYGLFVGVGASTGTVATYIRTGATTRGRAKVAAEKLFQVNITEPGSGYTTVPTITFTDPNNTFESPVTVRKNSGVLANPSFVNRGTQFVTGSGEVNTGDGYSDLFQSGTFVASRRLNQRPTPGSNVVFSHLPDRVFKLVNVVTFLGDNEGSHTAFLQLSPTLTISEAPPDGAAITMRLKYSQVRLTGHDFLDIGTGSFIDTNYPGLPLQPAIPANEAVESGGGRVFFTSTDQDGNFRVGDLFAIEQSTGVATLNADAFNISGLQELNLGNVTLGGGSATITEFSTDPFFTADSDNIVPTQRAIKAYIAGQIGGGGASLNVNSVTAGSIFISSNVITTVTTGPIKMNAVFEFRGGVIGLPIAFNYFLT